jgi:molybdopterin-guanine dinucleotide biosynthesis protein
MSGKDKTVTLDNGTGDVYMLSAAHRYFRTMTPWTNSVLCCLLKGCGTDIVISERFAAGKNKKKTGT